MTDMETVAEIVMQEIRKYDRYVNIDRARFSLSYPAITYTVTYEKSYFAYSIAFECNGLICIANTISPPAMLTISYADPEMLSKAIKFHKDWMFRE
jgi:hypothetical protein